VRFHTPLLVSSFPASFGLSDNAKAVPRIQAETNPATVLSNNSYD
jgi:hypothetical protein